MNNIEELKQSDLVISFATFLTCHEEIYSSIQQDAKLVYMHPIDNKNLKDRYEQFIKYEVGSEEGICALFLYTFIENSNDVINSYIDDLDLGYVCAESSAGEEEFEELYEKYLSAKTKTLIIGEDLLLHDRVENIVKFLAIIKKFTDFNLVFTNEELAVLVDSCTNFDLEDVDELKSFNGTLVYKIQGDSEFLKASQTFANISKVKDGDKINIFLPNGKIEKILKIDKDLNGTIAILKSDENILNGYKFKQVKIEKVDA